LELLNAHSVGFTAGQRAVELLALVVPADEVDHDRVVVARRALSGPLTQNQTSQAGLRSLGVRWGPQHGFWSGIGAVESDVGELLWGELRGERRFGRANSRVAESGFRLIG